MLSYPFQQSGLWKALETNFHLKRGKVEIWGLKWIFSDFLLA